MKESYPEGIINNININLILLKDGNYEISCPQWKYEGHSKNPSKLINELINELVNHNKECEVWNLESI